MCTTIYEAVCVFKTLLNVCITGALTLKTYVSQRIAIGLLKHLNTTENVCIHHRTRLSHYESYTDSGNQSKTSTYGNEKC